MLHDVPQVTPPVMWVNSMADLTNALLHTAVGCRLARLPSLAVALVAMAAACDNLGGSAVHTVRLSKKNADAEAAAILNALNLVWVGEPGPGEVRSYRPAWAEAHSIGRPLRGFPEIALFMRANPDLALALAPK